MDPLGVPSCEAMVTVGRVAIVAGLVGVNLVDCILDFRSFLVVGGRKLR